MSDVRPARAAPLPPAPTRRGTSDARVVVRPMPKVIFFYLTWIASLVFGIIVESGSPDARAPRHAVDARSSR